MPDAPTATRFVSSLKLGPPNCFVHASMPPLSYFRRNPSWRMTRTPVAGGQPAPNLLFSKGDGHTALRAVDRAGNGRAVGRDLAGERPGLGVRELEGHHPIFH